MRGELNLIRFNMELFEQFSGVAMSEDSVRREIVCRVHEVSLGRRSFAGPAYSGLRIADNTVRNIDEPSLKQRRKCKDDGGGVASGVGNEAGLSDRVAMQLGTSIDCFFLQLFGMFGVYVRQTVHGAVPMVF